MSHQVMEESIRTLSQVVCLNLDVHVWSGRRKLRPEDLKMRAGEFPPPDLATLGSKKICDPQAICLFHALYKRAQRCCESVGIRFLKGYALPEAKTRAVLQELEKIRQEFEARLESFLLAYESNVQTWALAHPGYEEAILKGVETRERVRARTRFGWQVYRIETGSGSEESCGMLQEGLAEAAKGLAGQLFQEVAQAARSLFDGSIAGREQCSRKAVNAALGLLGKLNGLAFLDSRVRPIVDSFALTLAGLPPSGPYRDADYWAIHALIDMLSDAQAMIRHGEGILSKEVDGFLPSVSLNRKTLRQDDWIEQGRMCRVEEDFPPSAYPAGTLEVVEF
ncbi:MAG: DUF3150 domain-containing protein [Pseudomonadota bacterium]|nr:DUF3150 domain-containing protein [Pseudomonadota bacterium]